MARVVLLTGGNVGDVKERLRTAQRLVNARIGAVLRRIQVHTSAPVTKELAFGGLSIFPDSRIVTLDEKKISLPPKEFDLLYKLAQNEHIVLSRDKLLETVWGYRYCGDARTVDVHIRYLRQKIEDEPDNPRLVVTLRGVGYRFASAEDLK